MKNHHQQNSSLSHFKRCSNIHSILSCAIFLLLSIVWVNGNISNGDDDNNLRLLSTSTSIRTSEKNANVVEVLKIHDPNDYELRKTNRFSEFNKKELYAANTGGKVGYKAKERKKAARKTKKDFYKFKAPRIQYENLINKQIDTSNFECVEDVCKDWAKANAEETDAKILEEKDDDTQTTSEYYTAFYDSPWAYDYVIGIYFSDNNDDSASSLYPAVLDSGSTTLGVASCDCDNCNVTSAPCYEVSKKLLDSSYCINADYGSGSWTGNIYNAYAGFSKSVSTKTSFAAIDTASAGNDAFFSKGYSAIAGFAFDSLGTEYKSCDSKDEKTLGALIPITDELTTKTTISRNLVSMSFCGAHAYVTVGDLDTELYSGQLNYVDAKKTTANGKSQYAYWLAEIDNMKIDNYKLTEENYNTYGGGMIDSGTTEIMITESAWYSLVEYLYKKVYTKSEDFYSGESCISASKVNDFPDLTINLKDSVSLTVKSSEYLVKYEGCYWFGISAAEMPIIGHIALQNNMVVFNKEKNKLGFATATCSSSSSYDTMPVEPPETFDVKAQPLQNRWNPRKPKNPVTSAIATEYREKELAARRINNQEEEDLDSVGKRMPPKHQASLPFSPLGSLVMVSLMGLLIFGVWSSRPGRNRDEQYQRIPSAVVTYQDEEVGQKEEEEEEEK